MRKRVGGGEGGREGSSLRMRKRVGGREGGREKSRGAAFT